MKKRILAAGLGIGLALAGAGVLTACGTDTKPTPDGISIHTNFDTTYYVGEDLDVTGGIINYTKDGKTSQVVITDSMITGFSNDVAGTRNMVITYLGETLVVSYVVKEIPEVPLSFEKVYCSNLVSSDGVHQEYFYVRFEKRYNEIYFRVASRQVTDTLDTSYNSQIWKEAYGSSNPVLPEAKLDCKFNTKTEKWESEKVKDTSKETSSGTIVYTFTNLTKNRFNLKLQISEFENVETNFQYEYDFVMTLI